MLKFNIISSLLLLIVLLMAIISSIAMLLWIGKYRRREILLRSLLIKQKEATQQAERKSMNKSLAFATASHDVRTCLAAITGLIELCLSEVSPQSELEKNLDQMKNCASKLLGILNSILDTSKIEAGKMQLEELECNVADVIEESVDIFHVVALKKGLEVIWDPCDCSVLNLPQVKGDPQRLKQILDNLLSNAVKFTSEGHIIVRAWAKKSMTEEVACSHNYPCNFSSMPSLLSCFSCRNNDVFGGSNYLCQISHDPNYIELVFEVDDTGIGIASDKRESVFENYVQVRELMNGQEGTGLGLGIVQSYVRLMGGEISIVDKGSNEKGTCFKFNIFLKPLEGIHGGVNNVPYEGEAANEVLDPESLVSLESGHHSAGQTTCKGLKHDLIYALLLIQGEETRKISKRWLERLGVKVWVVDHWELLASTLDKVKRKVSFSHFGVFEKSHPVMPEIQSDTHVIQNTDEIEREECSTRDGMDHLLPLSIHSPELLKKTNHHNAPVYILILIDACFVSVNDVKFVLSSCMRSINQREYKFVWLANSDTSAVDLRILRNKEIPCDLILHRPLHGSRLYAILKLLQEFAEPVEATPKAGANIILKDKCKSNVDWDGDRPLHGMRVLVVEDHIVLRRVTSSTLSSLGASVEVSENGKDAVDLIKNGLHKNPALNMEGKECQGIWGVTRYLPYDIIFMDCEMPIMNGYEATKEIRAIEKQYGVHIPVIALTAHTMPDQEIESVQAGMDAYLMKPLERNMLLAALRKINKN